MCEMYCIWMKWSLMFIDMKDRCEWKRLQSKPSSGNRSWISLSRGKKGNKTSEDDDYEDDIDGVGNGGDVGNDDVDDDKLESRFYVGRVDRRIDECTVRKSIDDSDESGTCCVVSNRTCGQQNLFFSDGERYHVLRALTVDRCGRTGIENRL